MNYYGLARLVEGFEISIYHLEIGIRIGIRAGGIFVDFTLLLLNNNWWSLCNAISSIIIIFIFPHLTLILYAVRSIFDSRTRHHGSLIYETIALSRPV